MKFKKGLILALLGICLSAGLVACKQEPALTECEKNGHNFKIHHESHPATCTEAGTAWAFCSECGQEELVDVPAKGHTQKTIEGTPATCTKAGKTDSVICEKCDEVLTPATTLPKGHTVGEIKYISEPSKTYAGYVEFKCGRDCVNSYGQKVIYSDSTQPDGKFTLPKLTDSAYTVEVNGEDNTYTIEILGKTVEFTVSNFEFYYDTDTTVTVYKYNGTSTNLVIPETYKGKTVVGINKNAFKDNDIIYSVTLPSTIKTIGESAFDDCDYLDSVVSLGGLETIGKKAFKNCINLNSITTPSTLKYIEEEAFYNCNALKDFNFSENIEAIKEYAFRYCGSLTKANVANTTVLYTGAFYNCSYLEEVVVPKQVGGKGFFTSCNRIKKITTYSPNIDVLDLFYNLDWYESYYKAPDSLEEITFIGSEDQYSIISYNNITNLKKVTIENCTYIDEYAFANCPSLISVTLPNEIEVVHYTSFDGCTSLSATLNANGKYLGNESNPYIALVGYANANNEVDFTVNENTKIIALSGNFWTSFKSYNIPASVKHINGSPTNSNIKVNYNGTVLDWLKIKDYNLSNITFSDGTNSKTMTELVLDDSYTYISGNIFEPFESLTTIVLPKTLKDIAYSAFGSSCSVKTIKYNGEHADWYNVDIGNNYILQYLEHIYFYNEQTETYYEPTYIKMHDTSYNLAGFSNATKIIIPKNAYLSSGSNTGFEKFEGKADLYYEGTKADWDAKNYPTSYACKFTIYFYQETEQTINSYLSNPVKLWHYDSNGEPKAWIEVGNTVVGKTYNYTTTTVSVSDTYWAMLQQAKAQGMLEYLFDTQLEVEMVTSSASKSEYEQKLANFSKLAGSNMTISFGSDLMTIKKDGTTTLFYVEINGQVYAKVGNNYSAYATIDGNTIIEGVSDEYVTVKHIWTCQ